MIRVVLADDSVEFLRAAGGFLRARPNVEVVGTAASGLDAIAAVRTLRPDLVLLDYEMPGMTGLEAAWAIKTLDGTIRVVIVSLHDQIRLQMGADGTGVDGFIGKATFAEACPLVIATLSESCIDRMMTLVRGTSLETRAARVSPFRPGMAGRAPPRFVATPPLLKTCESGTAT